MPIHPYPGICQQRKAWVVRACSTPHLCFSPPPPWERTHAQVVICLSEMQTSRSEAQATSSITRVKPSIITG